ncbi:MAG: Lpg1974 family pore-forming outer membrane protein [Simkaniaceae bacterium]|nr:Lpg1974 family pore-forming outer membrane protein [Simkaniaceae bacterium]
MGQASTKTDSGNFGASFTSGEFEKGWVGFQLFGSALYWHAKVGGTEYVYDLATGKKGKIETQRFDWDWGYRVGAGVRLPIVRWEIIGTYTHFGTQDYEKRGIVPPSLLIFSKGSVISSTQDARCEYKIEYDNIELNLHQNSFFSRLLGLAAAIGVKKTWIDQKQGVTYQGDVDTKVKDWCRFVGLGPMIGLNIKWHLFYGISFIAETKGALLFGNFEVKHSENETALKGDTNLFTPTLHFLLGLQWDVPMKWMQFSLSLGYEAEYFWRQNRSVEIKNTVSNPFRVQPIRHAEDLVFYGGILRTGIEF